MSVKKKLLPQHNRIASLLADLQEETDTTKAPALLADGGAPIGEPRIADPIVADEAVLSISSPVGNNGTRLLLELQDDDADRHWSEDERMLVEQVTGQLSLALENAHLIAQTQQALAESEVRSRELFILNEMSREFASNLDVDAIIENIYWYTSKLLETYNFYLALYYPETETVSFHSVRVDGNPVLPGHPEWEHWTAAQPANGLTGYVIHSNKPLLIEQNARGNLAAKNIPYVEVGSGGVESWLGVPMSIGDQVIGVITVQNETTPFVYNQHHLELLATIGNQGALAIQKSRLLEETRHLFLQAQSALAETETLYQASARFNAAQSYKDILDALCSYTILAQAEINVTFDLFDSPWTSQNLPQTITVLVRKMPMKTGRLQRSFAMSSLPSLSKILNSDKPTLINHAELDARLDENLRAILVQDFKAQSAIFAPLVVSGQWIGYVNGLYPSQIDYTAAELRHLSVLANLAAVAIQNMRLLEVSRKRADQLQTAAKVARDSSSTLALETLLDRAVNMICEGFTYNHASIFLLDEKGKNAVVRASVGQAGQEMLKQGHKLAVGSRSIIGHVTFSGQPMVVNDVSQDPIHRPNPLLPDTRSEAGIPLKIGEQVIGALDAQSTRLNAFTQDDIAVLLTLADQIAVAVNNAQAFELSQKAVEEMRKADQLKSQFLANMSHELRTPLNSIIGFSRVILKGIDGPVSDLQTQDLSAIHTSGQHLLNLINDILDLSKIEAGKMELTFEDNVNLPDMINSVMSTVIGLIKGKPIKLYRNVASDIPPLRADPIKLRQILLNLLSNAAKFTDEGSITIDARLQANPGNVPEVIVSVIDTGSGISEEDQTKLFQPFSQVDPSPTRKTGGTGLGLSICQHLVGMHGGRIGLRSEPQKGSTFYFTLPVPAPRPRYTAELKKTGPERVVLSIDDERQVIDLYQRYLSNHGYRVFPLTEPDKAVEIAQKLQPYAITLDIMMPDSSGWQVLEALKSNPETQRIPVIICSILEEKGRGFSFGATDYLVKPILEDDLVYALNRGSKDTAPQEVLLVDDSLDDQRLVQQIFQSKEKYRLTLAEDGQKALTSVKSHKPDAIVLDLFMPGMDGFAFLEALRGEPELKDIPVIIYTAGDLDEDQLKLLGEFSQAMLRKGLITEKELINSLEQTLRLFTPAQMFPG